jgi:hypothetical protein
MYSMLLRIINLLIISLLLPAATRAGDSELFRYDNDEMMVVMADLDEVENIVMNNEGQSIDALSLMYPGRFDHLSRNHTALPGNTQIDSVLELFYYIACVGCLILILLALINQGVN